MFHRTFNLQVCCPGSLSIRARSYAGVEAGVAQLRRESTGPISGLSGLGALGAAVLLHLQYLSVADLQGAAV